MLETMMKTPFRRGVIFHCPRGVIIACPLTQSDLDEEDAPVTGRADGHTGHGFAAEFLTGINAVPRPADRQPIDGIAPTAIGHRNPFRGRERSFRFERRKIRFVDGGNKPIPKRFG